MGFEPSTDGMHPWYVKRCTHVDNRFVVEIRGTPPWADSLWVDYVEDRPGGGVTVEAHSPSEETVDTTWGELVEKMLAGEPPDPDWD